MSFPGLIGHSRLAEAILKMVKSDRLPHAILFVGPEGAGKTTVAESLMRIVLGQNGDLALHPDFLMLDVLVNEETGKRKSQISVEQVRELTGRLGLSSLSGGAKVVWIKDASALSIGAVNALLKPLEEPKGVVLFVLRAGSIEELPATLVSRCQTFRFGIVSRTQIVDGLIKMGFSRDDAQTAAAQSLGRPGRAIRFLKESLYQAQLKIGLNQAVAFLNAGLPERLGQIMELIPKTDSEKEKTLSSLIDRWELVSRDIFLRQLGLNALETFPDSKELEELAKRLPKEYLQSLFARLREVRETIDHHINPHLALEHLAIT